MSTQCVINVDLADVWDKPARKSLRRTVAWGDEITVTDQKSSHLEVEVTSFKTRSDGSLIPSTRTGFIEPAKTSRIKPAEVVVAREQNQVLKVNFVDVQQGDGSVIESPDGKIILIDAEGTARRTYLSGNGRRGVQGLIRFAHDQWSLRGVSPVLWGI